LRDADLLRDLRLREAVERTGAAGSSARARRAALKPGGEHRAIFPTPSYCSSSLPIDSSGSRSSSPSPPPPVRERERRVRASGLERLEHVFLCRARRPSRASGIVRRSSKLHRQLLHQTGQLDVQLLQAARHTHRPALVAEMPLDLTDDVRRRVGGQLDTALQVEAVDRLDEADRADLNEVPPVAHRGTSSAARERAQRATCTARSISRRAWRSPLLVVLAQQDLVVDAGATRRPSLFVQRDPGATITLLHLHACR